MTLRMKTSTFFLSLNSSAAVIVFSLLILWFLIITAYSLSLSSQSMSSSSILPSFMPYVSLNWNNLFGFHPTNFSCTLWIWIFVLRSQWLPKIIKFSISGTPTCVKMLVALLCSVNLPTRERVERLAEWKNYYNFAGSRTASRCRTLRATHSHTSPIPSTCMHGTRTILPSAQSFISIRSISSIEKSIFSPSTDVDWGVRTGARDLQKNEPIFDILRFIYGIYIFNMRASMNWPHVSDERSPETHSHSWWWERNK